MPPSWRDGRLHLVDHFRVGDFSALNVFPDGSAGNGDAVRIQFAASVQFGHQSGQSAGVVHIFGEEFPRRFEKRELGRAGGDFLECFQGEWIPTSLAMAGR